MTLPDWRQAGLVAKHLIPSRASPKHNASCHRPACSVGSRYIKPMVPSQPRCHFPINHHALSTMKFADLACAILCASTITSAGPIPDAHPIPNRQSAHSVEKRQQFDQGEPIDADGKGAPFSGQPHRRRWGETG